MKITFERERFLASFQTVASVAPARSPKPILQNVKLEVSDQQAILLATDLDIGIRMDAPIVHVDAPGSAVLPVGRFGSILRESHDEKLHLEASSQGTHVHGEHSEFELPGGNPDEFPVLPIFDEDEYHEVSARLLKELIRRTIFATDNESSRYALGGVLLEMEAEKITAVGTDGRRLAKMEGPAHAVNGHHTAESSTIVPTRSMQLIERSLTDADAEVQLAARPNDVLIRSPRATIYSRLVEGRFPRWREVLPAARESIKIPLTVGPVFAALRQAAIVASEESRGVDFTFGEGSLLMQGATAEVGRSRVEMPIAYDGPPITLTLDNRYVADFLKVLDAERTITIDIENEEKAALFTTDDGYSYVVMPLARDR